MDITALAARHAGWVDARSQITAQNIAHVDTPGYRRAAGPHFAETLATKNPFALRATHPSHLGPSAAPTSPAVASFNVRREGPVRLQTEMVDLAANRRAHDLNVAISAAFHRFHMSVAR